jgi:type VI secretion system secreted protein VgrG
MAFTQENLACRIDTPLGQDALLVQGFEGREGVSELFRYQLRLASEQEAIDFNAIVGRPATLTLTLQDGTPRYINGIISSFCQAGAGMRLVYYKAELVPWFWLLTRKQDCRIFQEKTAKDIIQKVFDDGGFTDYDLSEIKRSQPVRDYCVQYRETDYAFVSRLMEDEGVAFYFKHEAGHHTMVLTDHNAGFSQSPYKSKLEYELSTSSALDSLHAWEKRQEINPGQYAHTDFNFETPKVDLFASSKSLSTGFNNATFVIYDYPGLYGETGAGTDRAKLRMEAAEAEAVRISGRSGFRELCSGHTFELTQHYRNDFNKPHLLTSVEHELKQNLGVEDDAAPSPDLVYANSFTCIPTEVTYRAPVKTPRPVIQGVQTAFVVGPSGEEIYTEKHGRVKVQFHWDRDGKADDNSSCWVRAVQGMAGKGWGAAYWPRIGQEVTVEFLEGDPDRPIVTGVVYNGQTPTPHALPDNQTISGLKTLSSKGGDGFNEFRFEDKKGEEYVFHHSEKDHHLRVKNVLKEWIGSDRHQIVGSDPIEGDGNAYEKINGEEHFTITGDQFASLEANQNVEIAADRRVKITGIENLTIDRDRVEKIGGDYSLGVTGAHKEKIDGKISREAGMDVHEKAGMNYAMEAGMNVHLKGGMNVVIEAGLNLTIKGAGGFVSINPGGVFIQGNVVMINSGGAADAGSGASPEAPTSPVEPDPPLEAIEAMTARPGDRAEVPEWERVSREAYTPQALALEQAAESGAPFCEACEKARKEQAATRG